MDGNRPGTLSDEALDRELDAALNAAPSPEFVARVRMRVAGEPIAAPWRASWMLVTAGAGACAVLLAVAVTLWSRPEPAPPAGPSIAADRTLPASAVGDPAAQSAAARRTPSPIGVDGAPSEVSRAISRAEGRPSLRRVDVTTDAIVMTQVIVSADDRRSFDALLLAIQQRRLPPVDAEEEIVDESLVPAPIAIADVVIEPVEIARLD